MSIAVSHTDFVIVNVTDFERSRAFYGETLGLTPGKPWGQMPAQEFETGNLTIAVVDPTCIGRDFPGPSQTTIALRVDDVAAARDRLEADGVVFFGETIDSGVCHMAPFADPDGNSLMLHHRYAAPES